MQENVFELATNGISFTVVLGISETFKGSFVENCLHNRSASSTVLQSTADWAKELNHFAPFFNGSPKVTPKMAVVKAQYMLVIGGLKRTSAK